MGGPDENRRRPAGPRPVAGEEAGGRSVLDREGRRAVGNEEGWKHHRILRASASGRVGRREDRAVAPAPKNKSALSSSLTIHRIGPTSISGHPATGLHGQAYRPDRDGPGRSEGSRVGKEGVRTCDSRGP